MWFESIRTLLSFVFCHSFCFWFGLFPLLSHCIPFSQSVSDFCFCFCMPHRFLLSYRCRFVSTFERLLLQQATFKAFKVSFFFFSSLCGWHLKCSSSSSLRSSYRHILTSSSTVHLLLLVSTKWLVYGDNGVWFLFHYETCGKKNVFGWCKGCSQ